MFAIVLPNQKVYVCDPFRDLRPAWNALNPVANNSAALTRNTPRIPSRAAHMPDSSIAANWASEVSDDDAPLMRPRSSGGVWPCNITLAAIMTTATPSPMPAEPISAALGTGATAIKRIDAPIPTNPAPQSTARNLFHEGT